MDENDDRKHFYNLLFIANINVRHSIEQQLRYLSH